VLNNIENIFIQEEAKNFIQTLTTADGFAVTYAEKQNVIT
jgi:hypothetical protein